MGPGHIRIIGGAYRGRKLTVVDEPGLRPTPDRVRETVFNWLQPVIVGARCLDLFSGTGALGFEALSRGAASVVMVDKSAAVIDVLRKQLEVLGATNAIIYKATVPQQLKKPEQPFDVVFLDPPFQENLLVPCCHYLEENYFLADNAYIYLESKQIIAAERLPSNWQLLKSKKAGLVAYQLAVRRELEE
jgi:16S rRNA (guanine966-N2)-methyltransferase